MTKKNAFNLCLILLLFCQNSFVAQVLINELMIRPSGTIQTPPNGLIYNSSQEYIELYNPSCSSINISGYFIAMKQSLSGTNTGGTILIPNVAAALIPPGGHVVIGSSNPGGTLVGNVDIPLTANDYCVYNGNFVLSNTDGWCALYDPAGMPLDCIYWSSSSNNLSSSSFASDFNPGALCLPSAVSTSISLMTPVQISIQYPTLVKYGGTNPSSGNPISRQSDGASILVQNIPSSIASNNCNGGNCVATSASFNLNSSVTQPSCNSNDGIIGFNPSPSDTYFYAWSFPTSGQVSSVNNLLSGNYTITITNSSGCSKDTTIVLTSANGPTSVSVTKTDPNCGQSNGSVSIGNVTGGTSPYTYNFNNTSFNSSLNYTNLSAATYSLVVKDANGCEYNAPSITLNNSNGPTTVAVTSTDPNCGQSNGSVSIGNVTGGTSPYTYNFNNTSYTSSLNYSNLSAATYSLVVKDANGCEYNAPSITLNNSNGPMAVSVTTTDPNCGQSNGSVLIGNVIGGTAPYTFNFNSTSFTSILNYSNLSAATYTLVVKDAIGCEYNAPSIILNSPNGPTAVSATTKDPSCGESNGSVLIGNVTGGTAPYEFNFNNLGFSSLTDYLNLSEGIYSITVKDMNGCNYQGIITLNTALGNPSVFIPNVFTPNEDNNAVNEEWKITTSCVSNVSCQIFNRWGNLIYEFDDLNGSWSGENLTGQKVSDGIYFYKLVLSYSDDSEDEKQGFITLIR